MSWYPSGTYQVHLLTLTRLNAGFIVGFICVYWLYRLFIGTYSVSLHTKWAFIAATWIYKTKPHGLTRAQITRSNKKFLIFNQNLWVISTWIENSLPWDKRRCIGTIGLSFTEDKVCVQMWPGSHRHWNNIVDLCIWGWSDLVNITKNKKL